MGLGSKSIVLAVALFVVALGLSTVVSATVYYNYGCEDGTPSTTGNVTGGSHSCQTGYAINGTKGMLVPSGSGNGVIYLNMSGLPAEFNITFWMKLNGTTNNDASGACFSQNDAPDSCYAQGTGDGIGFSGFYSPNLYYFAFGTNAGGNESVPSFIRFEKKGSSVYIYRDENLTGSSAISTYALELFNRFTAADIWVDDICIWDASGTGYAGCNAVPPQVVNDTTMLENMTVYLQFENIVNSGVMENSVPYPNGTYTSAGAGNIGTGKFGYGWTGAANTYGTLTDDPSLECGSNGKNCSYAFWMKDTQCTTPFGRIFDKNGGPSAYMENTANMANFAFNLGGYTSTDIPLTCNDWSFYVVTYDGTSVRIYVNGTPLINDSYSTAVTDNGNPMEIGNVQSSAATQYLRGVLDDVMIWNDRVLTQDEVTYMYNSGSGRQLIVPPGSQPVNDSSNPGDVLAFFGNGAVSSDFVGVGGALSVNYTNTAIGEITYYSTGANVNAHTDLRNWTGKTLMMQFVFEDTGFSTPSGTGLAIGMGNSSQQLHNPDNQGVDFTINSGNVNGVYQGGTIDVNHTSSPVLAARSVGNHAVQIVWNTSASVDNVRIYIDGYWNPENGTQSMAPPTAGKIQNVLLTRATLPDFKLYNLSVCDTYCSPEPAQPVQPNITYISVHASENNSDAFVYLNCNATPGLSYNMSYKRNDSVTWTEFSSQTVTNVPIYSYGASLTGGHPAYADPDRYQYWLDQYMGSDSRAYINGVSGQHCTQLDDEYLSVMPVNAHLVIECGYWDIDPAGLNKNASQMQSVIQSIVDKARDRNVTLTFQEYIPQPLISGVCTRIHDMNDLFNTMFPPGTPNVTVAHLYDVFSDGTSCGANFSRYYTDQIHIQSYGYQYWSDQLWKDAFNARVVGAQTGNFTVARTVEEQTFEVQCSVNGTLLSRSVNVTVAGAIGAAIDYAGFDGATNFSGDTNSLDMPVLEKVGYFKIQWNGSGLNFSGANMTAAVTYGNGWVSVDSASLPSGVNTSARVTVVGDYYSPQVMENGVACQTCGAVTNNGSAVEFDVAHFTNYSIEELVNVTPSGQQFYNSQLTYAWNAPTGNVSVVYYDVIENLAGTNVTVATGLTELQFVRNVTQETTNGKVYVIAYGGIANHTLTNALPFNVTLEYTTVTLNDTLANQLVQSFCVTSPFSGCTTNGTISWLDMNAVSDTRNYTVSQTNGGGYYNTSRAVVAVGDIAVVLQTRPVLYVSGLSTDKAQYWNKTDANVVASWSANNGSQTQASVAFIGGQTGATVPVNAFAVGDHNVTVTLSEVVEGVNQTVSATSATFKVTKLVGTSVVSPNNVTLYTRYNQTISWTAATNGYGAVTYDVVYYNGTNTTIASGVAGTSIVYTFAPVDAVGSKVYVIANDTVVAESADAQFTVQLDAVAQNVVCPTVTLPNEDNLPSKAYVQVNATTYSEEQSGAGATVNTTGAGTLSTTNCTVVSTVGDTQQWTCHLPMDYWYTAGNYTTTFNWNGASNVTTCGYAALMASQRTTSSVYFPTAAPGVANASANGPVTIRNTGNVPINISLMGYDLAGRSVTTTQLPTSSFIAGASLGTAKQLQNATVKSLNMQVVPSNGAAGNVWLWLSMPQGQIIQEYYTATPWQAVVTSG